MLSQLALRYGTDKFSHDFCYFYESILQSKRLEIKRILEIGVFFGSSINMWRDYFPNAVIEGMDSFAGRQGNGTTFPNADRYLIEHLVEPKERTRLHRVDQSNVLELGDWSRTASKDYDMILDDGSHLMRDQQQTLGFLFPHVKSGGVFIVEDLHTSNDSGYDVRPDGSNSTLMYLVNLANGASPRSEYMSSAQNDYILANVSSVIIHYSRTNSITAAIIKKDYYL